MSAADVIAEALRDCGIEGSEKVEVPDILEALQASRYEVVELPEPLSRRMWPLVIGGETEFVTVPADDCAEDEYPIAISGIGGLSISESRTLAAALLAAANAAEANA